VLRRKWLLCDGIFESSVSEAESFLFSADVGDSVLKIVERSRGVFLAVRVVFETSRPEH
jgi:hypothetical protein